MEKVNISEEKDNQSKWDKENERRRHNYVPLIFELLKQMGKKGMLEEMLSDAVQKKKDKVEAEKKKKEEAGDAEMKAS